MTLIKRPAPIEVINDLNGDVVNFFRQLRDNPGDLRRRIALTPYSREEFDQSRQVKDRPSSVERARRFFVSAMMAINGSFGEDAGGFSRSNSYSRNGMEARVNRWHNMPEYLRIVVARLRRVRIERRDALELFEDFKNRPGTLVYLDPPYLGPRANGYDVDRRSSTFHEELLEATLDAKCMVFISSYKNAMYDKHLTKKMGWTRKVFNATTKGDNGQGMERTEVLWFNRAYAAARRSGRIPVSLSLKERLNYKVNPVR
jgi:DNA adenine methylase